MEIQGFVIGEQKNGKLKRVDLKRQVCEAEYRKIIGSPSMLDVPGLYNLRIVAADFVDLEGNVYKKVEWFGKSNSCEADEIFELLP